MGFWERITAPLRKKRKIVAYLIDETGRIHRKEKKYSNNSFIDKGFGKEMAYIVDHRFTLMEYSTRLPCAFYLVNNPHPQRFEHVRSPVDGIGLKQIMDSKAIEEIFKNEGNWILMLILVLVAIAALAAIAGALKEYGVVKIGGNSTAVKAFFLLPMSAWRRRR